MIDEKRELRSNFLTNVLHVIKPRELCLRRIFRRFWIPSDSYDSANREDRRRAGERA